MRLGLALVVSAAVSLGAGQLPLPESLLSAKTVYLTSIDGIDRETLGHVASQFRDERRFELVADPEGVDLIVTLMKRSYRAGYSVVPIPGVGVFGAPDTRNIFSLVATDATTLKRLWANERQHVWGVRGTVKDLVKDLHDEIREVERLDRGQR